MPHTRIRFPHPPLFTLSLILLSLTLILYLPALLHPAEIITSYQGATDTLAQEYFWAAFAKDAFAQGEVPLWNPFVFSGMPFASQPHKSLFYPPHILFLLLSFPLASALTFFLHTFFAALCTYAFVRLLGIRHIGAFTAAVAFAFTGRFAAHLSAGHYAMFLTAAWIPAAFLAAELFLQRRSAFSSILLGAVLALQFLAGHAQLFLYSAAAVAIYLVWQLLPRIAAFFKEPAPLLHAAALLLLSFLSFLALSAIQLLPALEHASLSVRAGGFPSAPLQALLASAFTLPASNAWTLLFPQLSNLLVSSWSWETTLFVGIVPFALALAGIFSRQPRAAFFTFLAVLCFLIATGPLAPLFSSLPVFSFFRAPARIAFLLSFAVSVLAAFGLQHISVVQNRRFLLHAAAVPFLILLLFFLNDLIVQNAFLTALLAALSALILFSLTLPPAFFRQKFLPPLAALLLLPTSVALLFHYAFFKSVLTIPVSISLLVLAALVAVAAAFSRHRLSSAAAVSLLMLLIVLNLFSFSVPLLHTSPYAHLLSPTPLTDALVNDHDTFRVFDAATALPPYLSYPYHLEMTLGYDPAMLLQDYVAFASPLFAYEYTMFLPASPNASSFSFPPSAVLSLLNIKYVITPFPVLHHDNGTPNLTFVLQSTNHTVYHLLPGIVTLPSVYVYERPTLPRAYALTSYTLLQNRSETLRSIHNDTFNLHSAALEERPSFPSSATAGILPATFARQSPSRYRVAVNLSQPAMLIISEPWYPGWKAEENGIPLKVYRAQYLLSAVELGAGSHVVQFSFAPASYTLGRRISLTAAAAVLLYFLFAFAAARKKSIHTTPATERNTPK